MTNQKSDDLLNKINVAVAAVNVAETAVETAQADLVSRSKAVGLLLLEAKKLHPKVPEFNAFLKRVKGLKLSRTYDLLRLAGGRTTDEELRKDQRERVRKHRAKKKIPAQPMSIAKPEPVSVTDPDVTESPKRITQSPEISADDRRAQNAALDTEPEANKEFCAWLKAADEANRASANALVEFTNACHAWLPKITEQWHRDKALQLVKRMTEPPKAKVA